MTDFIPLPPHAAYVWLSDETLWLGLPSSEGHSHGHSLHFPASPKGALALLQVLRQRERAGHSPKLNERGAPSQALASEMLRVLGAKPPVEVKYPYGLKSGKTAEELGL